MRPNKNQSFLQKYFDKRVFLLLLYMFSTIISLMILLSTFCLGQINKVTMYSGGNCQTGSEVAVFYQDPNAQSPYLIHSCNSLTRLCNDTDGGMSRSMECTSTVDVPSGFVSLTHFTSLDCSRRPYLVVFYKKDACFNTSASLVSTATCEGGNVNVKQSSTCGAAGVIRSDPYGCKTKSVDVDGVTGSIFSSCSGVVPQIITTTSPSTGSFVAATLVLFLIAIIL